MDATRLTRTLLIADDHESVLRTLDYVLSPRYRVLLAGSGKAALDLALTETVDAALIDLHMPTMDGFQTCISLLAHARQHGRVLPVWLMTAGISSAAEKRTQEIGAISILRKPFDHEDLIAKMERVFSEPPTLPPVPPLAPGATAD